MTSREHLESHRPLELYLDHEVVADNAWVEIERHVAPTMACD